MAQRQRRVRGEGSIYQTAGGRWVGSIDLGWVGGKRVRRTVSAGTRRELLPKLARLRGQLEEGIVNDGMTVDQWMTYWLDEIAPRRLKPRTLATYRGTVDTWIRPHLGRRRLDQLRPDHVRALDRAMIQAGRSESTRRHAYAILHRSLKVAVLERRLSRSPLDAVDAPPVSKGSHGVLSLDEVEAVMALLSAYAADGQWEYVSRWLCALVQGWRQGEVLGLRWPRVDLAPGRESAAIVVQIQRIPKEGLREVPTKTDTERSAPLHPLVAEALRRHRETASDGYVWGGLKPTDPRRDWGEWKMLLWQAGVSDHPLHAARATAASMLGEANVPIKTIAETLGHSQLHTAWTHYVHSDLRQMREGLEAGWRALTDKSQPRDGGLVIKE